MYLAEIWRYPVKSMAGESLEHAAVTLSGIAGDRLVQVYSERGRIVTARTHPGLLAHRATLDQTGEPLVDGRLWTDPSVLADVRRIGGPQARLARDEDPETRFDVLPLLVATDGVIAAFGRDLRRLRPNLVIGGVHVDPPISRMSQLRNRPVRRAIPSISTELLQSEALGVSRVPITRIGRHLQPDRD